MKKTLLQTSAEFSDLTLHIVLATMPQRYENLFGKSVVEGFYGKYRDNAGELMEKEAQDSGEKYGYFNGFKEPVLYNPLRYYILGNYDIAYLALIDNFKFAQRVFEPQLLISDKDAPEIFPPHTFQSFSGITHPDELDLRRFFAHKLNRPEERRYFLGITNLKLNNGFLIGNGNAFLESAIKHVRSVISKYNKQNVMPTGKPVEYLIMHSFSWFEISVIVFADDPLHISSILKIFRRSTVSQLHNSKELIENSLYKNLPKNPYSDESIAGANVFADTQTYFGLHADLVSCKEDDTFLKDFQARNIKLNTEVEWQIKPGHMAFLQTFLKDKVNALFDWDERFLLAGKNDYYIRSNSDKIADNLHLLRMVFEQPRDSDLYNHVRKIKTRVQFRDGEITNIKPRTVLDLHSEIVQSGVSIKKFSALDKKLKALKVSRQIRSKVLKIFANYNNGIQDIILFPYFLDFKLFINFLQEYIDVMDAKLAEKFTNPALYYPELNMYEIEIALMKLITIFQEGYNIRMLNGYQFEDINDFDLDFNSSIQQLLSAYNTLAIEIGNLFYEEDYYYGPIVQLNLKDTVSNYNSINYYVHHLTSPEFVFATMTKEIFNYLYLGDDDNAKMVKRFEREMAQHAIDNDILQDLIEAHHVRMDYLINDATRFIITFDNNFELFQYWFWTYNLQNTSLFDETGAMNELHFRKELFRITFINFFFGHSPEKMICPLPELYTFWDRHYNKIRSAVEEILKFMGSVNLATHLMTYINQTLDTSLKKTVGHLVTSNKDVETGGIFVEQFSERYHGEYNPMELYARLSTKIKIYEMLDSGDPDDTVDKDSIIYLQWYMLHSLKTIYGENKRIVLLRRNWKDGKPLKTFLQQNSADYLYSVDQTGGLFFDDLKSQAKYFRLSSAMISQIWDFGQRRKKIFILKTLDADGK